MNNERIAKKVHESGEEGRQGKARPNSVLWMDGVRKALNDRGLALEQARNNVHDKVEWREFVNRM